MPERRRGAALVFPWLAALVLAACGGGGGGGGTTPVGPSACNPVAQTGCSAGQKCAWIETDGSGGGATGCVPAGTAAVREACSVGAPGPTTGYDDCAAGLTCLGGACRAICGFEAGSCGADFTCAAYAGLFGEGVGVCDPTCDPVRQVRHFDGAEACGSPDPSNPTLGCFGAPGMAFMCAPAPSTAVHREAPLGPASGGAFLNGCAPGYLPLLRESSGSSEITCIALCDPAEASSADATLRQGRSPYSCPDAGTTASTEECRHWWLLEEAPDLGLTRESNAVGFCIDVSRYSYEAAGGATLPWPSCADLASTDEDGDGTPDHLQWGCAPHPG